MSETMKVAGFVRDNGACGKYRVSQPLTTCAELGYFTTDLITEGTPPGGVIDKLAGSHVVVIPRPYDTVMLGTIERLQSHGVKVVADFDDNMLHISPWSVHYAEFGLEEVKVNHEGEIKPLWVDGTNIDLKLNRERIEGFKRALEMVDAVSVTQPVLAKAYAPYNDNIICLPNCIDKRQWQRLPLQPKEEVRLLWSGGSSHYQDVYILKNVLPKVCKKYPHVKIVIMGCIWQGVFGGIPKEQLEFHDWVHIEAYPLKHASLGIDVSLIPLEINTFNAGKSHIKLIEQSALAVPSITSLATPYREFYAGNNMVMAENDDKSWFEAICRMVEDADLRRSIGAAAQEKALSEFEASDKAKLWADAYYKVANQ